MSIVSSDEKRLGSVVVSGIGVAVFIAIIGFGIAYLQYTSIIKSEKAETTEVLVLIQKNLQYALREVNSVALLLSQTIDEDGETQNFEETAAELLSKYPSVNVLEIIKDNIVSEVYPIEGHERILGYNLETNDRVMNELVSAHERGSLHITGPIMLLEEVLGVIGILPVQYNNGKITAVAVVMYFDTLLKEVQVEAFSDKYDFLLYKYNNYDGSTEVFLNENDEAVDLSEYVSIKVDEGNWTLYVKKRDQILARNVFFIIVSISVLLAVICGYLSYKLFRKPFDLELLLENKSHELLRSREKFKKNSELLNSVLQSPEYIFIYSLDTEYKYLAFNDNHERIIYEEFGIPIRMGINILSILPESARVSLQPYFDRALKGEACETTLVSREDSGEIKYWQYWFSPIKASDDEVEGITVYSVDVTRRKEAEAIIEQSLNEKTTLLSEIHHRVKNNLAIVSGLLQLQKAEINDASVSAIFDQSINRIISIAMVHELMYNTKDLSTISAHDYFDKLIPAISATMQNKAQNVEFNIDVQDYRLNIKEAIPLGLLLNELITNSFKYAFNRQGNNGITIKLGVKDQKVHVKYSDTGTGYPDGVDFEKPKNLGLNLIHAQLKQLEASYEVVTKDRFELRFYFSSQSLHDHSNIEV